jgi:hypothetical protein
LNERELSAQEKEDIRRMRERSGVVVDEEDVDTERVTATVAAVGEGQRRPSWIWFIGNAHEGLNDPLTRTGEYPFISIPVHLLISSTVLRVEWAKAQARADRWDEEVVLLDEEMRRVLEYCHWKAAWWMEQVPLREGVSGPLAEGLRAYAVEQADMEERVIVSWTAKWAGARELAAPILIAANGSTATEPDQEMAPVPTPIPELDIDGEDEGYGAGDSDFEE